MNIYKNKPISKVLAIVLAVALTMSVTSFTANAEGAEPPGNGGEIAATEVTVTHGDGETNALEVDTATTGNEETDESDTGTATTGDKETNEPNKDTAISGNEETNEPNKDTATSGDKETDEPNKDAAIPDVPPPGDSGGDSADCICETLCGPDSINPDCPVCGSDDTLCAFEEPATLTDEDTATSGALGYVLTFTITGESEYSNALYLDAGVTVTDADLLAGVSAEDETGEAVTVTVSDQDGLDLENPQPRMGDNGRSPYVVTYTAVHPESGEAFTETRDCFVTSGIMLLAEVGGYTALQTECANTTSDTTVTLTENLDGTTQLTIGRTMALDLNGHTLTIAVSADNGIKINSGLTLTIQDSSGGAGKLNVTNSLETVIVGAGAGINTTDAMLIIESGTVTATGGIGGAGIGGGSSSVGTGGGSGGAGGTVTINGGTVIATGGGGAAGYGGAVTGAGAGIGGGRGGDNGTITINGGTVTAIGGISAAGLGGGARGSGGTIHITGGTVTATGSGGAAGIGGGETTGTGGEIKISGGKVIATGGTGGAGIGGGLQGEDGGTILISDGAEVEAHGGIGGAGIGGGSSGAGGQITISGGTVTANGSYGGTIYDPGGAGIGGGATGDSGTISITGGTVMAKCDGNGGAGIGGGQSGSGNAITISGSAKVTAKGGMNGAGIGGGYGADTGGGHEGASGTITIRGSAEVTATGGDDGAGIGGGCWGAGEDITIDGGKVIATGTGRGAGIGGGYSSPGGDITIDGGTVIATGGSNSGAGIGGGKYGAGGTVTINGGMVTAAGGSDGAGIGRGDGSNTGGTLDMDGDGVVFATSVSNTTDKTKGILFNGDNGTVYGDVTLTDDLVIPGGKTLNIPGGAKLNVPDDITLNNVGTITVENTGELQNSGEIINSGTISNGGKIISTGTIDGPQPTGNEVVARPVITTVSLPGGTFNAVYDQTFTATGGKITWSKVNGYFPDNLMINGLTGVISGRPTVVGTFNFTVKATNEAGSDTKALSIEIAKANQTTPAISGGNITKKYGDLAFPITATGGNGTGAYSFTSSNLGVATVNATGHVTLGTGASAIGSTSITVKRLGDNHYNDSADSTVITLTVGRADGPAAPVSVTGSYDGDGTNFTYTVEPIADAEYKMDNGEWQDSNVFPGIVPLSTHDFHARIKETDTHKAGTAGSIDQVVFTKLSGPAAPGKPTMTDRTATTITLTVIPGAEYRLSTGAWQNSPTFTGFLPVTGYTFYARIKATATHEESTESVISDTITTLRLPPGKPTMASRTADSITLTVISGAEYRISTGTWQNSTTFSDLSPNTGYIFYARLAENTTQEPSPETASNTITTDKGTLNGKPTITGRLKFGQTLTANTDSLTASPGDPAALGALTYQWQSGGADISGATGETYIVKVTDIGKTITVTVRAANCSNSAISTPTAQVVKADGPNAPASVTGDYDGNGIVFTYTITAPTGAQYEYSKDGAAWQPGTAFSGFDVDDKGTFYARLKATATHKEGLPGDTGEVAFIRLNQTDTPPLNFTMTGDFPNKTVTITTVSGAEYSFNGGAYSTTENTYISHTTENVTLAIRYAATATHNESGPATATVHTANQNQAAPSRGGGGSSSGGGASSPPTTVTIANANQPNMPTLAKASVTGTVDNGVLSAIITDKMARDAIATVTNTSKGIAIQFDSVATGDYENLSATFERAALERLKNAGVKSVKIGSAVLDLTLDLKAISAVLMQTNGNITVSAMSQDKLSDAAEALIGDRPTFDITIQGTSGGSVSDLGGGTVSDLNGGTATIGGTVSDLKGGTATIGIAYTPAPGEQTGNLYGVYVNGDGKPQLLTNSSYNGGKMIFKRESLSVYGIGYKTTAPVFNDTTGHWAQDNIDFVSSRGLISGTGAAAFSPDTPITRADFFMALGKLSVADVSGYQQSSFSDVPDTSPAMPYIEWAAANKIMAGMGDGKFGPGSFITREDMAVMMVTYAKVTGYQLPLSRQAVPFADHARISAYAKDKVMAIQQTGVIAGKPDNLFDPQDNMTRGEAATVLRRFMELVIDEGTARGWVQNDAGQWQYIDPHGKAETGWLTTTDPHGKAGTDWLTTTDGVKY